MQERQVMPSAAKERVLYEKPENGAGKSLSDQTVQEKTAGGLHPIRKQTKKNAADHTA